MNEPVSIVTSIAERVGQAANEFFEALARGEQPSISEFANRYPDIGEHIRRTFPALLLVGDTSLEARPAETSIRSDVDKTLGDFVIMREIGRGGMGTVFEAEQKSMGRSVALKVLPFAALAHDKSLQRFRNEVRAAAALDHPHIVSVYSVGEERGIHYYAMQLIRGQTLADMIEQLRRESKSEETASRKAVNGDAATIDSAEILPTTTQRVQQARISTAGNPRRAAEHYRSTAQLGIQAAEALQHAHDLGVLHRDIKPSNLMLDREGRLYVTDFGLARIEADAGMTMTGDIVGTLRYMAPEQALAKRVIVDHRADIYSLGATLYELLTLEPAFGEVDRSELLKQIAFEEPRALRKLDRRIPAELETIVLKAMAKSPDERYLTAQQLSDDLRAYLDDKPIKAKPPTLLNRAVKWSRRHRSVVIPASVIAVLLLLFATAVIADRRRQHQETARFVETSLKAARQSFNANNMGLVQQRLAEAQSRIGATGSEDQPYAKEVSAITAEAERYTQLMSLIEKARFAHNEADFSMEPAKQSLALYHVMEKSNWLNDLETAGFPESHVERVSHGVYEMLLLLADHLTRWEGKKQPTEAVKYLDKAISFHKPSRGYYWLLAKCCGLQSQLDEAVQLRLKALDTPVDHPAELFYIIRDREGGARSKRYPDYSIDQLCQDYREILRVDPTYYNAFFFMGLYLSRHGRDAEALPLWYACLATAPNDWTTLMNCTETHIRLKQFDEALASANTLVTKVPKDAGSWVLRGCAYAGLQRYEEAAKDFEQALAVRSAGTGGDWVATHDLLRESAWLLATARDDKVRHGKRAVELATESCELTGYKNVQSLTTLAAAFAELEDFDSAMKWSKKAMELTTDEKEREPLTRHLASFQDGKPWRRKDGDNTNSGSAAFRSALEADLLVQQDRVETAIQADRSIAKRQSDTLAKAGKYDQAARFYCIVARQDLDDHGAAVRAAFLSLLDGDRAGYEEMCRQMLDRFGSTKDPIAARRTCSACLISSTTVGDTEQLLRLAELAVSDLREPWLSFRDRGLAAYRARNWEDTLKWCAESRRVATRNDHRAQNLLIEAMTLFQLHKPKEAQAAFDEAIDLTSQFFPNATADGENIGVRWFDWVTIELLRREAVELLGINKLENSYPTR